MPGIAFAAGLALLTPDGSSAQLTAPGVSLELAQHRARTLSRLVYDVRFRIPATRDSAVEGTVEISLERRDAGPLILDFASPGTVGRVLVDGRAVPFDHRDDHLTIPATSLPPGAIRLVIEFTAGDGPLNRRDDFLYTLFVPDRAHEAFPCFDQPDLKARFRLTVEAPRAWSAVANGALVSTEEAGASVVHRFAETEPLPTYLFAFSAGRFEVEEAVRDGRAMRMYHRETDIERLERNRDAIFDLHATALRWLESYTGIAYPFGKFDFVAIPSFQYNGMEHPGAVLYRASSLFLDEAATRNQELGRASLIAHETAHMWFGDLVTMRWFDDVWMKEVFANFMAAKIVNPSFPDIDHGLRFFLSHYPSAYAVDRTPGANPIRQELENLSDAGSLYGAIIYQKAPIVMRQLELLTGEAAFRDAMRAYLRAHAFGNAGWPDLVAFLDDASEEDVPAWSAAWVESEGRPTITVGPVGDGIQLVQYDERGRGLTWDQRLTVRVLDPPPAAAAPEMKVMEPGSMAGAPTTGSWTDLPVRLAAERARVGDAGHASARAFLPNGYGYGYGLFILDPRTRDTLLEELADLPDATARAVAWVDLREMMLEGLAGPEPLLAAARRLLLQEPDELVAQQVLGDVTTLFWRYLPPVARAAAGAELERELWSRVRSLERPSLKAAYFNAWRSVTTAAGGVARMDSLWRGDLEVAGLPLSERDHTALALELALREAPGWAGILEAQRERIENPDRLERFDFIRPAVSADPAVRDSVFGSLADLSNRGREEWVVAALSYLHHPLRADESRHQIRPALELLAEIQRTGDIFFPTQWLNALLGGHASEEAAAVVREFIASNPGLAPRLMGKVLQAADPLFRAVRPPPPTGPADPR